MTRQPTKQEFLVTINDGVDIPTFKAKLLAKLATKGLGKQINHRSVNIMQSVGIMSVKCTAKVAAEIAKNPEVLAVELEGEVQASSSSKSSCPYEHVAKQILTAAASAPYIAPDCKYTDCTLEKQKFGAMFPRPKGSRLLTTRRVKFEGDISIAVVRAPITIMSLSKEQAASSLAEKMEAILGTSPQDGTADHEWVAAVTLNEGTRVQVLVTLCVKGVLIVMTDH